MKKTKTQKPDLFETASKPKAKPEPKPESEYHTISGIVKGTGQKASLPKTEKEESKEQVVITGYSLDQIERYLESFIKGNQPGNKKEENFREVLMKFVKDIGGKMTLTSKAKTLSSFMKKDRKKKSHIISLKRSRFS
jgi:hypothetical protein